MPKAQDEVDEVLRTATMAMILAAKSIRRRHQTTSERVSGSRRGTSPRNRSALDDESTGPRTAATTPAKSEVPEDAHDALTGRAYRSFSGQA